MYNFGRMQFPDQDEEPFRHTHPARAIFKLYYLEPLNQKYYIELSGDIVGRFEQVSADRLASDVGYLLNPQDPTSGLITPYGLPAYNVFDFRSSFRVSNTMQITVAVENIFDKKYRTAHSRMDAVGRNVLVGMEIKVI